MLALHVPNRVIGGALCLGVWVSVLSFPLAVQARAARKPQRRQIAKVEARAVVASSANSVKILTRTPAAASRLVPARTRPKPAKPPTRPRSVGANAWHAVRTVCERLSRGRKTPDPIASVPSGSRGPRARRDKWKMEPADQFLRAGAIRLSWRHPSAGSGESLVMVWDSNGARVWTETTHGSATTVPSSAGIAPGQPYGWAVLSQAATEVSPIRWFEVMTPAAAASLDRELAWVRDAFGEAGPQSPLHFATGCVYEDHGLFSEAQAEYEMATKSAPAL